MNDRESMNSTQGTARVVGVLFIIATAAGILSQVFLGPLLDGPDLLVGVAANQTQVIVGVLMLLIMAAAIFVIPAMLFPILQLSSGNAARGYVVTRIFEAVAVVVGTISLLLLVTLSQELATAGAGEAANFQTLGTLLVAARDWTDLIGTQLVFGLTALILNYSLYQSRLVPRFISVWGLVGAPLIMMAGLLGMLGLIPPFSTVSILLYLPIALQEMVFAVWLIVKGFDPAVVESLSAKQG